MAEQHRPELRCSECNRPFIAESCGLVHAIARVQLLWLRAAFKDFPRGRQTP
jgi:hypothetical protein